MYYQQLEQVLKSTIIEKEIEILDFKTKKAHEKLEKSQ